MTIALNMLVIFALLIAVGYAPALAASRAKAGYLTAQDLKNLDAAGLSLTKHAAKDHAGEKYNAQVIQEMLRLGTCSPKVYYPNCAHKTVLLGCKASARGHLWGLLVIGFEDWYHPVIVTGYAVERQRLDSIALRHGCLVPGLYVP